MIDKIGNNPSVISTPRPQTSAAANALRTISTLNAVAQKSSRASGGGSSSPAVKVFSINQTASNAPTSNQVPRGSLVDELV